MLCLMLHLMSLQALLHHLLDRQGICFHPNEDDVIGGQNGHFLRMTVTWFFRRLQFSPWMNFHLVARGDEKSWTKVKIRSIIKSQNSKSWSTGVKVQEMHFYGGS
ncbi:unnamed protein product [Lactuca virosa]|uniref:Secreted protein n=1 Tax=Lactuca virosa TaxID=75947 RepID=A0AAU9N657_9ASTR|nr:unnamed protein product [Lactuca virosa]